MKEWRKIFDSLQAFRLLEDDWDGSGGIAPDPKLIDRAKEIAETWRNRQLTVPCRVTASIGGGIIFEWQEGGSYRELVIESPFLGQVMKAEPNSRPVREKVELRSLQQVLEAGAR